MRLKGRTLDNSFVYQGYESPAYFCDREAETRNIISHLKNGRNVTLVSPRRIGKTGSKHHLMAEIFGSPKHPFYQSAEMLGLKPLKEDVYYAFCRNFFKQKNGDLTEETFKYIYDKFEGHTWYVQCIMNRLYERELTVNNTEQVNRAILSVLEGREPQFEYMVQFFTENQFALLKAIAHERIVAQPTASKFIKKHNLCGASSIKAALKVLEEKELVYRKSGGYVVYDRFMDLWLLRK